MEGGDPSEVSRERLRRRIWSCEAPRAVGEGDAGEEGGGKLAERGEKDPIVALGRDIMTKVMQMLDACSVARSITVSRKWREFASADLIWRPKCEELWKGKAHMPRATRIHGATMLETYSLASIDGKRGRINKGDLCDHVWEFRFKKLAPQYWRDLDPSWTGSGPAMRRYFHPDGSQTADAADRVWGGHESTYTIVTSFLDCKIRDHYVRINRMPKMSISRREDWSWMMGNDLYYYLSIPDVDKEGGTGPLFSLW